MKMTKLFKKIENAVGKGEIAHYEQFLLYPLGFQKTCTADTLKPELFWKRVKWVRGRQRAVIRKLSTEICYMNFLIFTFFIHR